MSEEAVPLVFAKKEQSLPSCAQAGEDKKKIRTQTQTEVVKEHPDSD